MTEYIELNIDGVRCGESAPAAKYTNREIGYCFALRAAGFSVKQIAEKMEIPYITIYQWLRGMRRGAPSYRVPKKKAAR